MLPVVVPLTDALTVAYQWMCALNWRRADIWIKSSRNCSRSVKLVFLPALSEGFRIGQRRRLVAASS
jgi:hypothetical protein